MAMMVPMISITMLAALLRSKLFEEFSVWLVLEVGCVVGTGGAFGA